MVAREQSQTGPRRRKNGVEQMRCLDRNMKLTEEELVELHRKGAKAHQSCCRRFAGWSKSQRPGGYF